MRTRLGRSLAICVVAASILASRDVRVTAACTSGIVTSPLGNLESLDPVTSANGRYTAFWSTANDLVPGDANGRYDVFVVDKTTCAVELVSVSTAGVQGNSDSSFPAISGDGRFVAFMSLANTLVAGDSNASPDIFVRDRQNNTTIRVSVTNAGGQSSGGGGLGSVRPDISANGQFVAFLSFATNLVASDTNGTADVFVRDIINNTTQRVSVATGGAEAVADGTQNTNKPAISADGRYIAFASNTVGLVAGDTNGAQDVFRHDRQTVTTIRVSVSTAGDQTPTFQDSGDPSISDDGRFIAFDSFATNLVADDTNGLYDVFVRDVQTGATSRVSLVNQGGQPAAFAWANSTSPSISADGRYVAFVSGAEDIIPGDNNGWNDVFVHDRTTTITRRVSTSFDGVQGDFHSAFADISGDGAYVAYASFSGLIVAGDSNFANDVFIADWRKISAPPNADLMRNGDFSSGTTRWVEFATPDQSYIVSSVTGGVYQYYRVAPPPGTANQAVVFQNTTAQLLSFAPIVGSFDLGNSSSARKRISILIHDADFSDLHVCTLWLAAGAPMRTYTMRTHTTRAWADATISFYAASPNSDGGFLQIDNVSLMYAPLEAGDRTECVDPTAPATAPGPPPTNVINNGTFAGGTSFWALFGQITSQVVAGVFEFIRPPGTPAGVIFQNTGQAMTAGQILTATFDLGNSSTVRKRVTAIVHESDFSDITACTFWLPPSSALASYTIRVFTTKPWLNATLSVYPATVGPDQWIRLDNVTLARTPAQATVGTECLEPGASFAPTLSAAPASGFATGSAASGGSSRRPSGLRNSDAADFVSPDVGSHGASAQGSVRALRYLLPPSDAPLEIQISEDGDTWHTLVVVEPSEDWRVVTVEWEQVGRAFLRVIQR